jgi:hypothetical protein
LNLAKGGDHQHNVIGWLIRNDNILNRAQIFSGVGLLVPVEHRGKKNLGHFPPMNLETV